MAFLNAIVSMHRTQLWNAASPLCLLLYKQLGSILLYQNMWTKPNTRVIILTHGGNSRPGGVPCASRGSALLPSTPSARSAAQPSPACLAQNTRTPTAHLQHHLSREALAFYCSPPFSLMTRKWILVFEKGANVLLCRYSQWQVKPLGHILDSPCSQTALKAVRTSVQFLFMVITTT